METASQQCTRLAQQVIELLGEQWLPRIYRERILSLRTRSYNFAVTVRSQEVVIDSTLLGIELRLGRHRLSCPDLPTARYLAVFARLGCAEIALPYDISRLASLADELEAALQAIDPMLDSLRPVLTATLRRRVSKKLLMTVSEELAAAGAGTPVPQFNQSTKQRP